MVSSEGTATTTIPFSQQVEYGSFLRLIACLISPSEEATMVVTVISVLVFVISWFLLTPPARVYPNKPKHPQEGIAADTPPVVVECPELGSEHHVLLCVLRDSAYLFAVFCV